MLTKRVCHKQCHRSDGPHPIRYKTFIDVVFGCRVETIVIVGEDKEVEHREEEAHKCEQVRCHPYWTELKKIFVY